MARQTVSQSLAALCGILDCSADDDEAVGRVRTLLSHCNYNVASATEQYFATGWIQEATTPSNIEMARGDGKRQRTVAGDSADVDGRDGAGMPEMEEPIAQIFVDAGRASYSSETQAVLAAIHGLSEQFTLSVQLDSALPRALQASLPIALVEAEIFREKEKQAGLTTCTCARVPHAALMSQPEYVFARGSARSSVSTLHIDPTYIYFIEDCTLLQVMVSIRANVDLSTQLAQCKTMLDLGRLPGLNFDARFNVIECDDCYRYSSFAPKALKRNHQSCGLIKGPTRAAGSMAARSFANVRQDLVQHLILGNSWHAWCACHAAQRRMVNSELHSAGINVGKAALLVMKQHQSDASFERETTQLAAFGVSIGSKNHSCKFMPGFRNSAHAVCVAGMQRLLREPLVATGHPPPFAAPADKATLQRRTGQMHGIITLCGHSGKFIALFTSVLPASDGSGSALAELLIRSLQHGEPFNLSTQEVRRQLTCFPGDGQYQSLLEGHGGLRVAEHLCEKLDLNYAWMWSRWDQAHEMELALNTVRSEVAYFKALASFVAARNEKYLFGKHHERVRQWAERWHTKLESMAAICTSRFHGSERRCYKNLFQNLTIFIADQEAELAALGVTTPPQDLLVAKSLETSVQLAGTIDLLGLTKDLSVHMQTVNTLPWEMEETIASALGNLEQLAADLKQGRIDRSIGTRR